MKQSTLYAIISFLFDNNMICWCWWWTGFRKATLLTITTNRLLVKESSSNKRHSHTGSRLICSLKVVTGEAGTIYWALTICRRCTGGCASTGPLTSLWFYDNHMGKPSFRGTGPGPSLYFSGKLLYFKLYIEINVRSRVMQGLLLWPLSKERVFFVYLCSYKGLTFVYNIFWSEDRLTCYGRLSFYW